MATILIIDDEEGIRALLRFTLEAAGHEVVEAANGREGLTLPPEPDGLGHHRHCHARTKWAGPDDGTDTSIPPREGDRDLRRRRRSQCLGSRETARSTADLSQAL